MTRCNRESACVQALRVWLVRSGVKVGRCGATPEPGGSWPMRILARRLRRSGRRWLKCLRGQMMECVNSTGERCSSSVVSNGRVELLDERRICKDQDDQL